MRDVSVRATRAASLLFCCSAGTFFFFRCFPLTAGTSTTKPWKHPSEEVVVCSGILYIRHAHTAPAECGPFRSNNRTRLRRRYRLPVDAPRGAPKDKSAEAMAVVAFDDDVSDSKSVSSFFFLFPQRDRMVLACPAVYSANVSARVTTTCACLYTEPEPSVLSNVLRQRTAASEHALRVVF